MKSFFGLLGLPGPLLLLLISHTYAETPDQDQNVEPWPHKPSSRVKHGSENPTKGRRDQGTAEEHLRLGMLPVGVKKMSTDESEKFWPEYWQFEEDLGLRKTPRFAAWNAPIQARSEEKDDMLLLNSSATIPFKPPFALHIDTEMGLDNREDSEGSFWWSRRNAARALIQPEKRAFTCPAGTNSCSAIGYPNSCCTTDETCFAIQDTGLGPVGCCPNGSDCGGTITDCAAGNTQCSDELGGGCCIPNYICSGPGCVLDPSLVVTVTTTVTIIGSPPTTEVSTFVTTVASSLPPPTTSSTSTRSTTSTTSSTSQVGVSTRTTNSVTGVAPVRPTSDTSTITSAPASSVSGTSCPVGFYACSAVYAGGCCRTGRDCSLTDCPPTQSTTIISSEATIVVPIGSAATVNTQGGSCATGWTSCPASVGGNCCPSGFACGTASCSSISASATEVVQKETSAAGSGVPDMHTSLLWILTGLMMFVMCL
ncbi:hypothetical protein F5884DRAFT_293345 [Xylogone sp. PMI_703]|nr:hypothetical protein F5884DRAFT_293345 [Xylogone sp. PMI_703]